MINMNIIGIGLGIGIVSCAIWVVGMRVTENPEWGMPWFPWVGLELGVLVMLLSPFVG